MTTYNVKNIPEPQPSKYTFAIDFEYGDWKQELGCIAFSIVRILHPPEYPIAVNSFYVAALQSEKKKDWWETMLWLIPLQYITNVRKWRPTKADKFIRPTNQMFIRPDKPAPANRMPEDRIRERLGEFGVEL
jgi:hypothetical protein